jgi:hypothetical protein
MGGSLDGPANDTETDLPAKEPLDWWGRQDSNLRSHEAADLQSAPFAARDTPPDPRRAYLRHRNGLGKWGRRRQCTIGALFHTAPFDSHPLGIVEKPLLRVSASGAVPRPPSCPGFPSPRPRGLTRRGGKSSCGPPRRTPGNSHLPVASLTFPMNPMCPRTFQRMVGDIKNLPGQSVTTAHLDRDGVEV